MKRVWFKRNDGGKIVPVWTSTDGKVDFKALGRHFLLNLETITLSGNVFPLDSAGKSDASWMQIKDALGVEGTEEDPVPVHGSPANAAEPSELVRVVKEFSQVSLQLQQLQKQVEDVIELVGVVKEQVGDVKELMRIVSQRVWGRVTNFLLLTITNVDPILVVW